MGPYVTGEASRPRLPSNINDCFNLSMSSALSARKFSYASSQRSRGGGPVLFPNPLLDRMESALGNANCVAPWRLVMKWIAGHHWRQETYAA